MPDVDGLRRSLDFRISAHFAWLARRSGPTPTSAWDFWIVLCYFSVPLSRTGLDRRMIDRDATFAQHLLEIAIAHSVAAIPSDRPEYDLTLKVTSLEVRHRPAPFRAEPIPTHAYEACNRALGIIIGQEQVYSPSQIGRARFFADVYWIDSRTLQKVGQRIVSRVTC
jgi:hypothetical protein